MEELSKLLRCLLAEILLWEELLPARFIVIVWCLLEKSRTVTITVRDDKYVVNTTLLESYSLLELLRVDHVRTYKNLANP